MQTINHSNRPIRSHRNDRDFAPRRKSAVSVLSPCNATRLDRGLPAPAQKAPAEYPQSDRLIGDVENDAMLQQHDYVRRLDRTGSEDREDKAKTPVFFHRATLFDSVMDFLDRYDQTAVRQQSRRGEA